MLTLRQKILDAYARVHARGILHNDLKAAHWRALPDSDVIRLIDFTHATSLLHEGEAKRAGDLRAEASWVRSILDLEIPWSGNLYKIEDSQYSH